MTERIVVRRTARRLAAGSGPRAVAVAAALVLLTGCGGSSPPGSSAAPSTAAGVGKVTVASDGVQEITLQTQDDYVFTPDHFTVKPGKVRLTVTNVAKQATHDFAFTPGKGPTRIDAGIPLLGPGDKKTIDFDVETPGDYPFQCSFHVQLGQVGTMTVKG
jgi:plastocyanin